jgi:hypothetical protein
LKALSTTAGFSGDAGLTGNLFTGEDNFRGLLMVSVDFCGDCDRGSGDGRLLFNIFNGDVWSRSIGLFDVSRENLLGDIFSRSASSYTFATNGELGMESVSLSVDVCFVV